jgi:phage gpG-like protein
MSVLNILEAVAAFENMKHEIDEAETEIIEEACKMVCEEAKAVLGTDGYDWPALSPETKKTQPGMLLETGEMRDSIEWTAEKNEGFVGSDNDKALWHELGTTKMPARSFLMGAALHKMPEIMLMAAELAMKKMAGEAI